VTPGTATTGGAAGLGGALPVVEGTAPGGGAFGVIGMILTLRGALGSSLARSSLVSWCCACGGGTPMTTRLDALPPSSSPSRLSSFLSVLGKLLPSGTTGLTLFGPAALAVMRGAGPVLGANIAL
jgi:hypothetical protein